MVPLKVRRSSISPRSMGATSTGTELRRFSRSDGFFEQAARAPPKTPNTQSIRSAEINFETVIGIVNPLYE
jgi:hypothetical protein